MILKEDWINDWRSLTDAEEKKEYLKEIPPHLEADPQIQEIKAWWAVRYFYADKAQTRLGDRFIWIILSLNHQYNNRIGKKEVVRIYNKAFLTPQADSAIKLGTNELKENFLDAASIYISTMEDPSPILGLIPRKDKTKESKKERVTKAIAAEHLRTVWVLAKDLEHMPLIAKALCAAVVKEFSVTTDEIELFIEEVGNDDFSQWFNTVMID